MDISHQLKVAQNYAMPEVQNAIIISVMEIQEYALAVIQHRYGEINAKMPVLKKVTNVKELATKKQENVQVEYVLVDIMVR